MFKSAKIAAVVGVMAGFMMAGAAALAAGGVQPVSQTKCTINDWECTPWVCEGTVVFSRYERTCTATTNCVDTDDTKPPEISTAGGLTCGNKPADEPWPACEEEDWACNEWQCTWDDKHDPTASRLCAHAHGCIWTYHDQKPKDYDSNCTVVPQNGQYAVCTADDWECTAWSMNCKSLGGDNLQSSRTCSRTKDCIDYNDTGPDTTQDLVKFCLPVADKYSPGYVAPQQPQQEPQQPQQQPQQQEPKPQQGDGQAWPDTVALIKSSNKISTTDLTPTSSIGWDKGLSNNPSQLCTGNTLIKTAAAPAVYYCGMDGKRYVFPNEKTYFSWYSGFGEVTTISTQTMSSIMIGGNVTYRPGMRMVKITSDPKVYAVSKGGVLRPIAGEAVAQELYGSDWNTKIDDISDAFFVNYTVGSALDF